jgi:hypothetical protein
MDKLNADGNMLGRVGALAVIVALVIGYGKATGTYMCPVAEGAGSSCCLPGK